MNPGGFWVVFATVLDKHALIFDGRIIKLAPSLGPALCLV
jgi:hypothetical protein